MRTAYSVETVRAAERELMARLPEGALMARAAAGLAAVCAGLLGRVYGSRVVVLAGPGDNGGDALYAGARLARRGARRAIPVEYPQKGLQPRPAVRIDLRVRKVNGSVSHSVVTESREGR